MLSLANVTNAAQAASYFSKDDYYLDREQREPSEWWGRGATYLNLHGEVDRQQFTSLLEGRLPNGKKMPGCEQAPKKGQKRKSRRVGIDMTFSAPKSVSLLGLVGGDRRIAAAHGKAVEAALGYLENETAQTRVTKEKNTEFEPTRNFVVARFHHDTSRELDPQMHTHCVAMNVTQRSDGSWRALSNESIYKHKMAAGMVYRAELAHALIEMGYAIDSRANGTFEVRGFEQSQLEAFSKRRQDIIEKLESSHNKNAESAARATLLTRQSKREVDRSVLSKRWAAQAEEAAIDFELVRSQQHGKGRTVTPQQALHYATEHLTERDINCAARDVIRHSLSKGMGKVRYRDVQREIHKAQGMGELVGIVAANPREGLNRRYTTSKMISMETKLVELMSKGIAAHEPIMPNGEHFAESSQVRLTSGQRHAVETILRCRDSVLGVQGFAGTGKTTMLCELRKHAEAQGYKLRGFAPSSAAAEILQAQSGIETQTVARGLHGMHGRGNTASGTSQREVWVVDEVSMVGTRDATDILRAAHRAGARTVFLGDTRQLPSIESGKVFDLLMDRGMTTAAMTEVVRQKDETHRRAVVDVIAKDPAKSLQSLGVCIIPKESKRLEAIAAQYLALPADDRKDTFVLTGAHRPRQIISEHIREGLRAEGGIHQEAHATSILVREDLTRAQIREAFNYRPEQVVRFGRDYKKHGVARGETFTVASIDSPTNTVTLRGGKGQIIAWQPHRADKVEVYQLEDRSLSVGDLIRWTRNDQGSGERRNGQKAIVKSVDREGLTAEVDYKGKTQQLDLSAPGHWDHGYVATVNALQGGTCKYVIINTDTGNEHRTGIEPHMVGISRATHRATIFADNRDRLPVVISQSLQKSSALQRLEGNHVHEVERLVHGIDNPVPRHQSKRVVSIEKSTRQLDL